MHVDSIQIDKTGLQEAVINWDDDNIGRCKGDLHESPFTSKAQHRP